MKSAGVQKIVVRLCGRALFAAENRAPARRQSCHMHVFDAQKPASITLVWSICRPEKSDILVTILLTFLPAAMAGRSRSHFVSHSVSDQNPNEPFRDF